MPKKLTTEGFILKSKELWGDTAFSYNLCDYKNAKTEVTLICNKHNLEFGATPLDHMYAYKGRKPVGCPECGKESFVLKTTKTTEQYIKDAIAVHGDRYDYSKVNYSGKGKEVTIVCKIHGDFSQIASVHLGGCGCRSCADAEASDRLKMSKEEYFSRVTRLHPTLDFNNSVFSGLSSEITYICQQHGQRTTSATSVLYGNGCYECGKIKSSVARTNDLEYFIKRGREAYGDLYTYENSLYEGNKQPITVTCKVHGDFPTNAGNHMAGNGGGCPKCAGINSTVEQTLVDLVGLDCERGNRTILDGKEIDILYGTLGVEVNGAYWHSLSQGKYTTYHLDKTLNASDKGVKLIHFWDFEIADKPEIVVSMIKSRLGKNTTISARTTEVVELTTDQFNKFVEDNHISGKSVCSKRYGLEHNGSLVATMGFSKSRFDKSSDWEIVRFCNVLNKTVVGGASKLLNHFIKSVGPQSIVSYADRRFGEGEVYNKLGFQFSHSSKPNYFHIKGHKRYSRYTTQKHNLKALLGELFNENLSEIENLKNCGFHQVFDCGNNVYRWSKE